MCTRQSPRATKPQGCLTRVIESPPKRRRSNRSRTNIAARPAQLQTGFRSPNTARDGTYTPGSHSIKVGPDQPSKHPDPILDCRLVNSARGARGAREGDQYLVIPFRQLRIELRISASTTSPPSLMAQSRVPLATPQFQSSPGPSDHCLLPQ